MYNLARGMTGPGVSPRGSTPKDRGEELLPIDIRCIEEVLKGEHELAMAVSLVVLAINYLWPGGHESSRYEAGPKKSLSKGQLAERVRDLKEVGGQCPGFEEGLKELVATKFNYAGGPIMCLEELVADKVIPVWPQIGEAAIQDVVG